MKKIILHWGREKKNKDGFELQLTEVINKYLGKKFRKFVRVEFHKLNEKDFCYVEINRSTIPVFLYKKNQTEFVIRSGNRTQSLDVKDTTEYIKNHWSGK